MPPTMMSRVGVQLASPRSWTLHKSTGTSKRRPVCRSIRCVCVCERRAYSLIVSIKVEMGADKMESMANVVSVDWRATLDDDVVDDGDDDDDDGCWIVITFGSLPLTLERDFDVTGVVMAVRFIVIRSHLAPRSGARLPLDLGPSLVDWCYRPAADNSLTLCPGR